MGYSDNMVPVGQQQQQQQAAGSVSQPHMATQQQAGNSQQLREGGMQQAGYGSGMYAQPGMMHGQQQQQSAAYPGMGQQGGQPGGYPNAGGPVQCGAADQSSRPLSPPGMWPFWACSV